VRVIDYRPGFLPILGLEQKENKALKDMIDEMPFANTSISDRKQRQRDRQPGHNGSIDCENAVRFSDSSVSQLEG
jgi:hypothetical protein